MNLASAAPRLLVLDTCLQGCQAAVLQGDRGLAALSEPMSRGHQERLGPMTRQAMATAGLDFSEIDLVAVTVGPGSFTGLRVGLAFAKGVALALDRPCLGVDSLEALAASETSLPNKIAVIDAGRGRVYVQAFALAQSLTQPESLEIHEAQARFHNVLPQGCLALVGPGAYRLAEVFPDAQLGPRQLADPLAIGRLAIGRLDLAGPRLGPTPIYLRPPDAIPKADRRA